MVNTAEDAEEIAYLQAHLVKREYLKENKQIKDNIHSTSTCF